MTTRDSRAAAARLLALCSILAAVGGAALAQQTVPFANGIPVAPELPVLPLPDHPLTYKTAEGMDIRVVVVARGIEHPWSIAFLPNDVMLVTQTHGGMRVIRKGVLDPTPVAGVPEVKADAAFRECSTSRCIRSSPTTSSSTTRITSRWPTTKARSRSGAANGTARRWSARRTSSSRSPTSAASRGSRSAATACST